MEIMDINKLTQNLNKKKVEDKGDAVRYKLGDTTEQNSNSNYTEIKDNENSNTPGTIPMSDFLKLSEIEGPERGEKIVFFVDYSINQNKFDEFSKDVNFTFVDRSGFKFKAIAFGKLNTSNLVSETNNLKELKGNAVVLKYSVNVKGDRIFINPETVIKCKELHGKDEEVRMFFREEIEEKAGYINSIQDKISKYPRTQRLFNEYFSVLVNAPIKEVLNHNGSYLMHLNKLIDMVGILDLELVTKEDILMMDIASTVKYYKYNLNEHLPRHILVEAVYNALEYENPSLAFTLMKQFRVLIYTELLAQESLRFNSNNFYCKPLGNYVDISKEDLIDA